MSSPLKTENCDPCYFVDRVLSHGISHIRDDIIARYVTFLKSLRESPSTEVSVLVNLVSRDIRITTGSIHQLVKDVRSQI